MKESAGASRAADLSVTDVVAETNRAYDRIAEAFARARGGEMPDSLQGMALKLVHHMGQDGHIVDLGCGPGRDLAWFESQGVRATGVDLSDGMLAHAKGSTKAQLARMDMRQLGFRDGAFDGAWCAASLLHLPKSGVQHALREIRRVVRTGGTVMVLVKRGKGEARAGGYVEGVLRFFAYYQPEELAALLSNAGFGPREPGPWCSRVHGEWISYLCLAA